MAGVGLVLLCTREMSWLRVGKAEGGGVLSPSDSEISNRCPEISFSICVPFFDFIISSLYWETITNQAGDWARRACTTMCRICGPDLEDGNEAAVTGCSTVGGQREMLQALIPGHQEEARFRNRDILDVQKQLGYKADTHKKFRKVRKTNWRIC